MMENWLFWAFAAGITGLVALVLLRALVAGPEADDAAGPQGSADVKVYRDQLAEVERDQARGLLSAPEAERLRTEVSRRLLDADRAATKPQSATTLPLAVALVPIALLLGGAVVVYERLGAPGYPDLPLSTRLELAEEAYRTRPAQAEAEAVAPKETPPEVDAQTLDLVEQLRAKLREVPDDPKGLGFLARYEARMGNYSAAAKAQVHLTEVLAGQASAEDHVTAAQMLVVAAGGYVSPEAEAQLQAGLQKDPSNGLGRYYTGLMFAQTGRPDLTFKLWEPLLREGPADAPWIAPIAGAMADVAVRAGVNYTAPDTAPAMPALKGPSAEDMAAAEGMSGEDRQAMIAGMVAQLSERLYATGGTVEEWERLITSLGVLGEANQAEDALARAEAAFAGDEAALARVRAAAASVAP